MKAHASRIAGIDLARGLAVVLMIQTHAFDGWVRLEERSGLAFRLTRVLGSLPLPLFLSLAGLSLGLQVRRAAETERDARALRRGLLRGGARVLAWGYALNGLYAWMDGARGLATLLRFDVLHVIGLSSLCLAAGIGPRSGRLELRRFEWLSLAFGITALLACPLLTRLAHAAHGPFRYAWAPLAEVPGLSSMPLSPLAFFAGLFAAAGSRFQVERLARHWAPYLVCLACSGCGAAGAWLLVQRGVVIRRDTVGIWFNALDLAGRAGLVTLALLVLAPRLHSAGRPLAWLGRQSLLVYAVHLPFCYGLFARPIKHALDMASASVALLALLAGCVLLAWLRSRNSGARQSAGL